LVSAEQLVATLRHAMAVRLDDAVAAAVGEADELAVVDGSTEKEIHWGSPRMLSALRPSDTPVGTNLTRRSNTELPTTNYQPTTNHQPLTRPIHQHRRHTVKEFTKKRVDLRGQFHLVERVRHQPQPALARSGIDRKRHV